MFSTDLSQIFNFVITPADVIAHLTISLLCGILIAQVYRWTYSGPNYTVSFVHALIAITMITAVVIMVIGNNLARAFGLVGAMSIIRFRTAVKDAHDIVFIFFSLAIGLAAGVGLYRVAFSGALGIGLVILVLNKFNFAQRNHREYLLQFSYEEKGIQEKVYEAVLEKYCRRNHLINVRSLGREDILELSYNILLKRRNLFAEFVQALSAVPGVTSVNCFFDDVDQ